MLSPQLTQSIKVEKEVIESWVRGQMPPRAWVAKPVLPERNGLGVHCCHPKDKKDGPEGSIAALWVWQLLHPQSSVLKPRPKDHLGGHELPAVP